MLYKIQSSLIESQIQYKNYLLFGQVLCGVTQITKHE